MSSKIKKRWKTEQPKDGDGVLLCAHAKGAGQMHWWKFPDGVAFTRPDGSDGLAVWLVACLDCFHEHAENPLAIPIIGDATWIGNAPVLADEAS